MIIFPLHLLYLLATTEHTATSLLKGLRLAITNHLVPDTGFTAVKLPYYKFFRLVIVLTVGITLPGLLWFAAVSLASSVVSPFCMSDISIKSESSFQSKRCNR